MNEQLPELCIDDAWLVPQSAEEFGAIGRREACETPAAKGEKRRRILFRRVNWSQVAASPDEVDGYKLEVFPLAESWRKQQPEGFAAGKTYLVKKEDKQVPLSVFEQTIDGVEPLRQSLARSVAEGNVVRYWELAEASCEALEEYLKHHAKVPGLPWQCPTSLAAGREPAPRVVLLDAGLSGPADFPGDGPAGRLYGKWFGAHVRTPDCAPSSFSRQHAAAMAKFLLAIVNPPNASPPANGKKFANAVSSLESFQQKGDLAELKKVCRDMRTKGGGPVAPASTVPNRLVAPIKIGPIPSPPEVTRPPTPPANPWFKRSVLGNILLVALVLFGLAYWYLILRPSPLPVPPKAAGTPAYFVVFPMQENLREKVGKTLQETFPEKVMVIKRHAGQRSALLLEQLTKSVDAIPDRDKLAELLKKLNGQEVNFKGFNAANAKDSLPAIVKRGAIFSWQGGETKGKASETKDKNDGTEKELGAARQHSSLLHPNGLKLALDRMPPEEKSANEKLLLGLKEATAEYAALNDALNTIGNRSAFLIKVPDDQSHDKMRQKIVDRLDQPVFVSRPALALFDAVDLREDTGTGTVAVFSVKLPLKTYWRLVGEDDRSKYDLANANENEKQKLRWQLFKPDTEIKWNALSLLTAEGRTQQVASFDLAVASPESIFVVFRNQTLYVGDSEEVVKTQAQKYLEKRLQMKPDPKILEESVNVSLRGKQFIGTLMYSNLAEPFTGEKPQKPAAGSDVQVVHDEKTFSELRQKEDAAIPARPADKPAAAQP